MINVLYCGRTIEYFCGSITSTNIFKMREYKTIDKHEAVKHIKSGDRVFLHSITMTPHTLVDAMVSRHEQLRDVEIVHIHTEGPAPYVNPNLRSSFFHHAFFVGANVREAVQTGIADYIPVFLSEMPA